ATFPGAVFGRDAEIEALAGILVSPQGSVLVVGEPGSGRTCVLHEAARRAHERTASGSAFGGRGFWKTAAHRLISGARWLGDWQEICETIARELSRLNDTLWIEDVAGLLQAGGDGPEDSVAAFFAPFLERGEIRIAGEITPRALEALRPRLPAFFDRFEIWPLPALEHGESLSVLERAAALAERDHDITFDRAALESAVRLARRHIPHESFPGKAVRLLGTCFSEAASRRRRRVDADDVLLAVIEKTGLPDVLLRDDIPLPGDDLRRHFAARIVGQPEAVDRLARVVQLFKSGLNDPARPVATLLFAGPTGVGKTASARAIAEYVFGAGQAVDPLVRVDMSELQDPGQIARLVGGAGDPGGLLGRVRERPFSVVLFDEVEKAHPAFFDALLTVLDEGLLTDAWGRVTDFRSAVVILTTNLGTPRGRSLGFGGGPEQRIEGEVRAFFRPEFFNRIDQVVPFRPLDETAVTGIVRRELALVGEREGLRRRGIPLDADEDAVGWIARHGFDPVYGARPLQRLIERSVVGPVARRLLTRPLPGTLRIGVGPEGLVVRET
ncbi:MAG: ATP-dependent Clp protease ATP-binding subunit, partial [Candidatus Brocadiae bacterium]|nr:ATP-dependent Clp protease ATP-binding subunit [Candidatus Brocadiia bacterium]